MECNTVSYVKAEQFRATRFWNAIVTAVREELPVGRHRKGLKHFENCFPGDEAVSWTLKYLEQNRDDMLGSATVHADGQCTRTIARAEITRAKVTLLLQKFVEQKIIEDVRGRGEVFRDSARYLYTFNQENVDPLNSFNTTIAGHRDDSFGRKGRSGSLSHISAPAIKSATSFVKTALVGLSSQKERRESSPAIRT